MLPFAGLVEPDARRSVAGCASGSIGAGASWLDLALVGGVIVALQVKNHFGQVVDGEGQAGANKLMLAQSSIRVCKHRKCSA